ncbi:MAG: tetratricopeptide repeat protein [Bdellovibrionaceae bacterium]|nr:tetratricopeptide repeat protein [Pseudobdellovibrionaceae bacterium]
MSVAVKLLFSFLILLPFVWAESPAPTQVATTVVEHPAEMPKITENMTFEESFRLGTKSYQGKQFEDAIAYFNKALGLHPDNPEVLTNLGLSYFQSGKSGLSIAMLRRALSADPAQETARAALKFVLSKLEVKEIPHQIETYERLRSSVLNSASLASFHFLLALFLFCCGAIWLRFLGRRRKALALEEAPPGPPVVGIIFLIGFFVIFSLTVLKSYDLKVPRATIIADKVGAQIAPGEGQTALFDLYTGFEVIIRNSANDWIQISYPGGLTGWVKKESLMATSSKNAF